MIGGALIVAVKMEEGHRNYVMTRIVIIASIIH